MTLELFLIRYGRLSSLISIIASLLSIIASNQEEETEISKICKKPEPVFPIKSTYFIISSILLGLVSNYISYNIAEIRLVEVSKENDNSNRKEDITPSIMILVGTLLSLFGTILSLIAALLEANNGNLDGTPPYIFI